MKSAVSTRFRPATIRLRLTHRRLLRATRNWLSGAFGVSREDRATIVLRMLEGHARSGPTYWLQLCIALSLATLGLVLNGAAVVIGAMLVSPLMTPIIELGMGLAVGSPLLSIRSLVRTFWSIVVVIAGAALITTALPFQQVTAEISARMSPTALDLLVAIFCALAAAFTTLRSASESASTAAGTAVAIALVPPLCVVGFGVGTADRQIAQGAFLLFTANLCGILLFAAMTFWVFGFNLVDTRHLEEERLAGDKPPSRSVRLVTHAFGSRYGTWLRLAIPLALVVAVWLPLSRALREVTWEVRTRVKVQRIIHDLPLARAAVRSTVSVEHRAVRVRMVVVGKPSDAHALQVALATKIAQTPSTAPVVEVVAVPDLDTMEEVARKLAKVETTPSPPPTDLLKATGDVGEALKQAWPGATVGQIRRWLLDLTDQEHPVLEVAHLGPPLGATAEAVLASMLSERAHAPLVIRDIAVPSRAITASSEGGATWLPSLISAVEWIRGDRGLFACVMLPPPDVENGAKRKRRRRGEIDLGPTRDAALTELARAPQNQVHWVTGTQWFVQLKREACEAPVPTP